MLKRMDLTPTLHTKLVTTRGNGAGLLALEEAGCELPGNMTLSTMVESLDPRASMRNLPSRGQSRASSRGGAPSTPRGGLLSPRDEMARSFLSSIDESQLGTKPMLELGELNPLQYFGERALLDSKRTAASKRPNHTASVATLTECEVLLLSRYDFYHCIDEKTQKLMKAYAEKFYFDEEHVRRAISKQHRWDAYKTKLLHDTMSPRGQASPRG